MFKYWIFSSICSCVKGKKDELYIKNLLNLKNICRQKISFIPVFIVLATTTDLAFRGIFFTGVVAKKEDL